MASIDEVAEYAGVSTATVSRVINNKKNVKKATKEKVLEAIKALDYVKSSHASSLASGKTQNIAVVVPNINQWFFAELVEGIEHELLKNDYDLTLYTLRSSKISRQNIFNHFIMRQHIDGIIAVAFEITAEEIELLQKTGKPIIGVGGFLSGATSLSIDDEHIAYQATRHLIELGHRRIGHISGSKKYDKDFHVPIRRASGYKKAMLENNLEIVDKYNGSADFNISDGYQSAKKILKQEDKPTAIFAASDEIAFGVIKAAQELNIKIPEELSIIGIDDHELSALNELSTIKQNPYKMGRTSVKLLLAEFQENNKNKEKINHKITCQLMVRRSTVENKEKND